MVDLSKQILAVADLLGEAIRAGRFDVDKHLVELRTIAADVEALEKELADAYKDIDREEQWAKQVTAEGDALLAAASAWRWSIGHDAEGMAADGLVAEVDKLAANDE